MISIYRDALRMSQFLRQNFQRRKFLFRLVVSNFLVFINWNFILAYQSKLQVSEYKERSNFTLSSVGVSAPIISSSYDFPGVLRVLKHLQKDIERVTGAQPNIYLDTLNDSKECVIIGTIGKNLLIDRLIEQNKIDVTEIRGKWETYLIQVVEKPFPQTDHALIIVGSDKRGTIYGTYELSTSIGVSPWYWWADVPVKKQSELFISPVRLVRGEPKVQYRGIFINDEAPALSGWAYEKFGGFNSKFYEHVFELILRLRGNFLWPAMWGRAFYDDDPENPRLADEYGIVVSTSHHEPMMRAHDEWRRYGKGLWNYDKNDSVLRAFWTQGIHRIGNYESIVTLAMRGDGDEPMSEGANISLLQRIVRDQRQILSDVSKKDVTTIPQVWALYKEVQDYYDKGMRVPDDVTLLLCDDNWGNIRRLPKLTDQHRKGGYGIYYHYDYVGGPRNYKWLNTNQIERVWEQMQLAYEYGARKIWIVNVGDIKPMEFPISFFLDYAWNPEAISVDELEQYPNRWAEQQFGKQYAKEIAAILKDYTRFNARRKPELLSPETYSLVHFLEAETIVNEYKLLAQKAQRISDALLPKQRDAFYQLVLHPVLACSNLNDLYVTVAKNRLYAKQGRILTNELAQRAKELFFKDSSISDYYNRVMAGGKWSHMMDQTHIGYTYWQQPDKNNMPEVKEIGIPAGSEMGVTIEGSEDFWLNQMDNAVLPEFDSFNQQKFYLEIFNRGKTPFQYNIQTEKPWLKVTESQGIVETEKRIWISVDWKKTPVGKHHVPITILGPQKSKVVVNTIIIAFSRIEKKRVQGYIENNGYVSIEAENYSKAIASPTISWIRIPNLGRTHSAITTFPVTAPPQVPGNDSTFLEYVCYFFNEGDVEVNTYLSPTLNFHGDQGLRYAVSFDDEKPEIIHIHRNDTIPDWKYPQIWNKAVSENIRILVSHHRLFKPGTHTLRYWMVDPGVVLQKIVVKTKDAKSSYLGPPESKIFPVHSETRKTN
jgi:hypothetical protein